MNVVFLFLFGGLILFVLLDLWLRSRGRCLHPSLRRTVWYQYGILAVAFTSLAVREVRTATCVEGAGMNLAVAATMVACMIWQFYQQRPQFTLRGMFLATLLVAAVCSACHYVSLEGICILFLVISTIWTEYRRGEYPTATTNMVWPQSEPRQRDVASANAEGPNEGLSNGDAAETPGDL